MGKQHWRDRLWEKDQQARPWGSRADMKGQGDRSPVPALPPAPGCWWPVGLREAGAKSWHQYREKDTLSSFAWAQAKLQARGVTWVSKWGDLMENKGFP